MNLRNSKLFQLILAVLLATAVNAVFSNDLPQKKPYGVNQNNRLMPVFKFTDSNGNINYSSSIPNDFTAVEQIVIDSPPSVAHVEDTRERLDKLKTTAMELSKAREKRQAIREEKEIKQLQRLALLNRAKPQPVYQQNVYYPYRLSHHFGQNHRSNVRHRSHRHHPVKNPVHFPANSQRLPRLPLPSSSFRE